MSTRSILARGAFFVVGAVSLAGCGGGVSGDSIADVAGNPITKSAFAHWIYVAAKGQASQSRGAPVIIPDPPDFKNCMATLRKQVPAAARIPAATLKTDCGRGFTQLRDQVMDFLIRAYWYQADAAAQHVKVTDAQVQQAFQSAKQQQFPTQAQYQAFLTQTGQTQADILYRVRVNQIYRKLIAKASGGSVTPAKIQAYYSSHLAQFGSKEARNIRIVLTKTKADALKAMAALQHGASWKATAKQYSTDQATKLKGGQLIGVTKGQQDSALDQAAFSAPAQKLSGPIQGQFGYYVFKVTSIKAATQQPLAAATPSIRQLLTQQQSAGAQSIVDAQAKKKYLAKTICRSGYVMMDCKGYKAPAASSTPTGAPPSSGPPPSAPPQTVTPPPTRPPTTTTH